MGQKGLYVWAISLFGALTLSSLSCSGESQTQQDITAVATGDIIYHGHKLRWVRSHAPIQTPHPLVTYGPDGQIQLPAGVQRMPDPGIVQTGQTPTGASPIESMSVDELAEALRPMVLVNGQEYVGADPDYETAQALKSGTERGER